MPARPATSWAVKGRAFVAIMKFIVQDAAQIVNSVRRQPW